MQRTLFDYARKTASVSAEAATAAVTVRASSSAEVAPAAPGGVMTGVSTTKRSRSPGSRSRERSASASRLKGEVITGEAVSGLRGASKEEALEVEDSNSRVVLENPTAVPSSSHREDSSRDLPSFPTSSRWLADLIDDPKWKAFLAPVTVDTWHHGGFARIERFLDGELAKGKVILPPKAQIFSAFHSCPFADLKVVLLGQDPYHNLQQAHGLSFSVLPGVAPPPSLKNMYKELTADIPGFQAPAHGYLQSWAAQGMLLLNATLTVEAHQANSHSKASGWQAFTDAVIARLSAAHPNRLVFLLWGSFAQQKKKLIDTRRHVVLESVHPSPLSASRGWFGCHCFSACNKALVDLGHLPMYWQLPLQVQAP